ERFDRIDDFAERLAAGATRQREPRRQVSVTDSQSDARHAAVAAEALLDRQELVERAVLRLAAIDTAARQDGGGRVMAVGVRQEIDAFDRDDLVLEALAGGGGVVERLEAAVFETRIEARLAVAVAHHEILGADAMGMVNADELERQLFARGLSERVLDRAAKGQSSQ